MTDSSLPREIQRLRAIMASLRDPKTGCPWDIEQDFKSIAPYTIEEAYEVADAIEREDMGELRGELGDLLLQVVYHSQMAEEAGAFDLTEVVRGISDKMVARHPHVFGDADVRTAEAQTSAWEMMKAQERGDAGALGGVALALPALMRAAKLQKRASRVGFDWPDSEGPKAKISEELQELEAAEGEAERLHEAGDLLFSVVNLLRHMNIDPEVALRQANSRFETRFQYVEENSAKPLKDHTITELEDYWQAAKSAERNGRP
ncbi:nucleoside triphosphate pyrophosphohydrolase [Pacificimonas sp. WHA3]|uniref:Nucleoside triphosphate pyrophosphohydrolase n=1 Tax=Pacificimonas pallii TaxID=2827236 RepID=A0ABS6SE68_9SPHN|nr:nucleoside triphosphate pyrophosphohydrolase [Pacificimonas pallii]MBV7256704.1 nucleoside triphosphate pyrophosphohydrolase [Pacificimonas pallii]